MIDQYSKFFHCIKIGPDLYTIQDLLKRLWALVTMAIQNPCNTKVTCMSHNPALWYRPSLKINFINIFCISIFRIAIRCYWHLCICINCKCETPFSAFLLITNQLHVLYNDKFAYFAQNNVRMFCSRKQEEAAHVKLWLSPVNIPAWVHHHLQCRVSTWAWGRNTTWAYVSQPRETVLAGPVPLVS